MGKPIYFCEHCEKTNENNRELVSAGFPPERLDFKRGYIYGDLCNNDFSICPYCGGELLKADITEEDYVMLGKVTNNNRQLLDSMVGLHKKDIIEYELKMSQFRNQYEQGQQAQKQDSNSNIPKCPTCSSTNITHISAASRVINAGMFGLLGNKRKKTFHCNNCKFEW